MATAINIKQHTCNAAEAAILLELLTDAGDPVMLWGAPGVAKSAITFQLGERTNRKVIEFRTNIREPVDVRGCPVPDPETGTTRWYVPDELPQVKRDGERGILFLDEINTGSPQMMAVMFGLVLDRRVGEYTLPDGWVIVAAGNRMIDKASANRMSTALRSRFAHVYIEADIDTWCDWATRNDIAPELVAFQRLRRGENGGKGVLHIMPVGDDNAFPTPRTWARCSKYVKAPRKHRMRLFATHVGDAYAAELDGFIDLYHSIGSLEEIVKNPDKAPVPTEPSLRYAVVTGIARLATKANLANVVKFAKRLEDRESEMLVVHDATMRDPTLKNTATYGAWAVENADLNIQ